MDFGFDPHPELIEFSLPHWHSGDLHRLSHLRAETQVFIGSTSWNQRDWIGPVFPPKTLISRLMEAYGVSFDTIELNSTHYNIPPQHVINRWCQRVPDSFKFCPKVPQFISHRNDLGFESGYLDQYLEMLRIFGRKLGIPFIQFPPYFTINRSENLIKWIAYVQDQKHQHAIEFRNSDWFNGINLPVMETLIANDWPLVITDTSGRRDLLHMRLTSKDIIIRFVACGVVTIDQLRLNQWVARLKPLIINKQLNQIYFFMHDPEHYKQAEMAFYLKSQFNAADISVRKVNRHQSEFHSPDQYKLF